MDAIDLAPLRIGLRLRLLRVYAGDSVSGVAARWGKHQSYVYRVERGDLEPSPLEVRDVYERAERVSEQLVEPSGAGGSGLRRRALPASADLDAAKAPHEHDPLNPQDRSTRRRRGTQADA